MLNCANIETMKYSLTTLSAYGFCLLISTVFGNPLASTSAHSIDLNTILAAPLPPNDIDITKAHPLNNYNIIGNESWVITEHPSIGLHWIYHNETQSALETRNDPTRFGFSYEASTQMDGQAPSSSSCNNFITSYSNSGNCLNVGSQIAGGSTNLNGMGAISVFTESDDDHYRVNVYGPPWSAPETGQSLCQQFIYALRDISCFMVQGATVYAILPYYTS